MNSDKVEHAMESIKIRYYDIWKMIVTCVDVDNNLVLLALEDGSVAFYDTFNHLIRYIDI